MKIERPTIYLVDDEQPVLDGLSVTLNKTFPNLKICGKARSGMEALQGIAREKPDIIMMDVRMPGMSGLDTLREVNKILPDTVTILLTAYERFDIAQDAYSLGVYKYLVKPVSQEDLTETLAGALAKLNEVKNVSLKAALEQERFENSRPLLEMGFIWSVIMGDQRPELFRSYGKSLGLAEEETISGHFAVISRKNGRLNQEEFALIRREITNRLDCVPGPLFGGVLPVFIPGKKINQTRDSLRGVLETLAPHDIKYSIGAVASNNELRLSFSQAILGIYREDPEPLIGERKDKTETPGIIPGIKAFTEYLNERDMLGLRSAFIEWSLGCPEEDAAERAIIAGALCALLEADAEKFLAAGKLQYLVKKTDTRETAEFAANLLVSSLISADEDTAPDAGYHDRRIRRALLFIAEHYSEQISLEDAAACAGTSPAHLSRLFSTETGTTFSHQLTQFRIARSCKELNKGTLSIKEIAVLCGYHDANYFSRAFKNTLGMTPSEWKEQQ
jgi:two-component system response regulator YesN